MKVLGVIRIEVEGNNRLYWRRRKDIISTVPVTNVFISHTTKLCF